MQKIHACTTTNLEKAAELGLIIIIQRQIVVADRILQYAISE